MEILVNKLLCRILLIVISIFLPVSTAISQDLSEKVSANLETLSLGAHDIDISNWGSKVTVSGFVASQEDKDKVIKAILAMKEVEDVVDSINILANDNNLLLDDSLAVERRIAEVREATESYLQGITLKGAYALKYEINEQGVLISGELPPGTEKQALLYQVGRQVATPINENITVRPWPNDDELAKRVRTQLSEIQKLDLSGISISVSDGVVLLKGKRVTHLEVDQLAAAVLMVEGVREFKSELTFPGKHSSP